MAVIVLDYFRLLFSWPIVIGAVAAFSLVSFKAEIRGILQRVASVKIPGFEFLAPQGSVPEAAAPAAPPQPIEPNIQALNLSETDVERLKSWLDAERYAGKIWEFQYLNYYFAQSTQFVLNWLLPYQHDTTMSAFDAAWIPYLPRPEDREAALNALASHKLIERQGQLLRITPKGRDYAAWPGRMFMGFVMPPNGPMPLAINIPPPTPPFGSI